MNDQQYMQFIAGLGALSRLVVLSILLERGLACIFEHEWFRRVFTRTIRDPDDPTKRIQESKIPGLRGTLAMAASIWICSLYSFDVLAVIFSRQPDRLGMIVTGIVAAGGSAGAIAVFQGFLNFGRDSREAMIAAKTSDAQAAADVARLEAEAAKAAAAAKKAAAEAERAEADVRTQRAQGAAARAGLENTQLRGEQGAADPGIQREQPT